MTASILRPREVFRPSLVNRVTAVIILHNHPSGEIEPFNADEQSAKLLLVAGEILGIKLIVILFLIQIVNFIRFGRRYFTLLL